MLGSIRYKFVIVFFMLVLIAMIISGVFTVQFLQTYQLKSISEKLDNLASLLMPKLESYHNLDRNRKEIDEDLDKFANLGFGEEIFVVSEKYSTIIATTTANHDRDADDVLNKTLFAKAFISKKIEEDIVTFTEENTTIKSMDKVFPVIKNDRPIGFLYLRYDLKETNESISKSILYILESTLLALLLTIVLGSLIAKNISDPINDVTEKASKMAMGDFNQYVEVKSDDEIGKLAEMFNHLTRKLRVSLSELSSEKSKFEAIINSMEDGLVAINRNNEIMHINPVAKKILTINPFENEESFDDIALRFGYDLSFDKIYNDYKENITNQKVEIAKDIYLINTAPYLNDVNNIDGFIIVFQDITEQEKLENMRKDFVANVSHELKTPLTSIKSYSETLLDGMVEDKEITKQFLEVITTEADRMSRLVRDLLQLSNFDSNKVRFEMEFHDYVVLIGKVLKKIEVQAHSKSQKIKFISELKELVGYFDYDRIEQVALNLVTNAIKYTPNNGEIEVYVFKEDNNAIIKVVDNGMGIPEKDQQRIFERFYRVDKARSRELGGTGLGLPIAKEIIEHHGGRLEISSEVNLGTTVRVVIPLNDIL